MSRRFFCVFLLLLLNWLGKCEEPSDHTLGNNYEQIFHSMPTLFEYLLEMLENQSGLLEKNEISFFQDSVSKEPKEEVKREIKEGDSQIDEFDGHFKGFTDDATMDITDTVSSNFKSTTAEFPKALRIGEVTNAVEGTKPKVNNDFKNKYATRAKKLNQDNEMISKVENNYKRDKRDDDKIFAGSIDWTDFFVTADEVEENSVKIEQAIEDYNKNKNKKR